MSLYDKSSLLQVPSLYKDGTLVSTIPEDRSGDFTVSRGSNLAATRIGPDGYIKKGYENLLLHSNDFSQWTTNGIDETSGQEGYDDSNDAWLIEKTNVSTRVERSISYTGVSTFSVYAKAGTLNWMQINVSNVAKYYNLENGTLGSTSGTASMRIDFQIESVGNGWYRCSITTNQTVGIVRIYPAQANGNTSGTTGSIYIQDAQLEQGLVATDYIETGASTAQGGLLENTPRLDWSNGVPSVLVEEGSTNLIPVAEYGYKINNVSLDYNNETSPEGVKNGLKVTSTTTSTCFIRTENITTTAAYTFSAFVKYGNNEWLQIINSGDAECFFNFNCQTGEFGTNGSNTSNLKSEDYGNGWWRVSGTFGHIGTGTIRIYLSNRSSANFGGAITTIGNYFYNYGWQLEEGSNPSSYIPTYVTTQTRSKEVISDDFNIPTTATIYNSFYSDVAETVFVFDQVFNVVEGLNKVAIAFSPTAVKISVGGSIVANATGTYDTTSLTNIQLGSNNGTDYSNAPISGFYVFPEFLTDEELNSLTD